MPQMMMVPSQGSGGVGGWNGYENDTHILNGQYTTQQHGAFQGAMSYYSNKMMDHSHGGSVPVQGESFRLVGGAPFFRS